MKIDVRILRDPRRRQALDCRLCRFGLTRTTAQGVDRYCRVHNVLHVLSRFWSCLPSMPRAGVVRCPTGGHKAILDATDNVLRAIAMPMAGAPRVAVPQRRDEELYRHIRENIILWNSDAAGDEQLAGSEAISLTPSANDIRPCLPNSDIVHRDKAHADRRVPRKHGSPTKC